MDWERYIGEMPKTREERNKYFRDRSNVHNKCIRCFQTRFRMNRCFDHWLNWNKPNFLGGWQHNNKLHYRGIKKQEEEWKDIPTKKLSRLYLPNMWKIWQILDHMRDDDLDKYYETVEIQTELKVVTTKELVTKYFKNMKPYAHLEFTDEDIKPYHWKWMKDPNWKDSMFGQYTVADERDEKHIENNHAFPQWGDGMQEWIRSTKGREDE